MGELTQVVPNKSRITIVANAIMNSCQLESLLVGKCALTTGS